MAVVFVGEEWAQQRRLAPDGAPAPRVMTLDIAGITGWCRGRLDQEPESGAFRLQGKTIGARGISLDLTLRRMLQEKPMDLLVYESPVSRGAGALGTNAGRVLIGLAMVVEMVAHDYELPVFEEEVSKSRAAVTGRGGFAAGTAKQHMAEWLAAGGHPECGPDEADARILWLRTRQVKGFQREPFHRLAWAVARPKRKPDRQAALALTRARQR